MARRGISLNPGYISGSHWALCDQCGSQFREEDLQETWDHFWVCDEDYETRHPQDFLRVRAEVISVEQPIRPEDTTNTVTAATTIGAVTTTAANFANTSAVSGAAEAGLAICGTDDGIPAATHGLIQGLTSPPNSQV